MTLEELSLAVERRLVETGLFEAQKDNRIQAAPDGRTIRYYTTLGLIDRPFMQGRQARYGRRHLLQLLAIKALQGTQLPLSGIQARLYGRSEKELEAVIAAVAAKLAAADRRLKEDIAPVVWREIMIEPGLKILADQDWSCGDLEPIVEKLKAVLAALRSTAPAGNGG